MSNEVSVFIDARDVLSLLHGVGQDDLSMHRAGLTFHVLILGSLMDYLLAKSWWRTHGSWYEALGV